jgi:hypothetical protein
MGSRGVQAGVRQLLPLLAFCAVLATDVCIAQSEPVIGEGGSASSEPIAVLSTGGSRVPVRQASREITDTEDSLLKLVWDTRETTRTRLLSTKDHTPWQIMHGLLGLRSDFLILHNGQVVNGLDWIRTGPTFRNEPWFQKTQHGGRAHPYSQPYWFEGHINQFVAILASCNVPLEATFNTPSGPITMADMLKNAQMTVNSREEVTWTLWALATYLPSDARWTNAAGEEWSIERLVQVETAKPVGGRTSPCGGTHGLFALARARNVYLRTGKPLKGVWFEADQKIKKYIEIARLYRNADGSLSSGFFKTREYKQEFDKRMASQGHLLEFLMMSVSQQELHSDWIRRAVEATANDLNNNQKEYVECSPLYHAANALSIYLDRMAQEHRPQVAEKPAEVRASDLSAQRPVPAANPQRPGAKTATRPPKAAGAGGIAPPAPPAKSNLALPPAKTPAPAVPSAAPDPAAPTQTPSASVPARPAVSTTTPVPAAAPAKPATSTPTATQTSPAAAAGIPAPNVTPAPSTGEPATTSPKLTETPVVSPVPAPGPSLGTPQQPLRNSRNRHSVVDPFIPPVPPLSPSVPAAKPLQDVVNLPGNTGADSTPVAPARPVAPVGEPPARGVATQPPFASPQLAPRNPRTAAEPIAPPSAPSKFPQPASGGPTPLPDLSTKAVKAIYPDAEPFGPAVPGSPVPAVPVPSSSGTRPAMPEVGVQAVPMGRPAMRPLTRPGSSPFKPISMSNPSPSALEQQSTLEKQPQPSPLPVKDSGDDIILLDDFLATPPDPPIAPPRPTEKPPAAKTPAATTSKRPLRQSPAPIPDQSGRG